MKYSKILIDGHNLYHRNYNAHKNLTFTVEGREIVTGGVYGFLRSLNSLRDKYLSETGEIYVLFDNANSKLESRRKLSPEYKANRESMPKSFFRAIEFLQLILLRYDSDMYILYRHNYEADDLVEPVISQFGNYDRTLLVSTDLDWARSLRENVHWLSKDTLYTPQDFTEAFSFEPSFSAISFFKTFKGDSADNILNPIPRFPFDQLKAIMSKYSDIYDLYSALESGEAPVSDKWAKVLLDEQTRQSMYRNWELVSFAGPDWADISDSVFKCEFSHKKKNSLRQLYHILGFQPENIDSRFKDSALDSIMGWDVL